MAKGVFCIRGAVGSVLQWLMAGPQSKLAGLRDIGKVKSVFESWGQETLHKNLIA